MADLVPPTDQSEQDRKAPAGKLPWSAPLIQVMASADAEGGPGLDDDSLFGLES